MTAFCRLFRPIAVARIVIATSSSTLAAQSNGGPNALPAADVGSLPLVVSSLHADCSPRWAMHTPLDRRLLYVSSIGEGPTNATALEAARDNASRDLARTTSAVVSERRGPKPSDRAFFIDIRDLGSGVTEKARSDFCQVRGHVQVWVLTVVPVDLYWNRVKAADPAANDVPFASIWSDYVRTHGPPTAAMIIFRSLYSPGAVQRRSDRAGFGWMVFSGVIGGAAVGVGGYIGARIESQKAEAEVNSQTRRDYFNNQSSQWSGASRIGFIVAGTAYAVGLIDALATSPDAIATWRIGPRWSVRLGVRP